MSDALERYTERWHLLSVEGLLFAHSMRGSRAAELIILLNTE